MSNDSQGLDSDRMIVLSLKPRFAQAILAGVKTVELRRTVPYRRSSSRRGLSCTPRHQCERYWAHASSLASGPLISRPYGTSMAHDQSCPSMSSSSTSRAWPKAPL